MTHRYDDEQDVLGFLQQQREARRRLSAAKALRGSRFKLNPPSRAGKRPLCPDCGEPMEHLLYDQKLDSDFYGCMGCSPSWREG